MNTEQRYVLGFGLIRIMTGLKNFWSVTRPYHLSRLYLYDLSLSLFSLDLVMSLATLFEFIGMALAYRAYLMLGVRTLMMFCLIGVSIGFLNSHFVTETWVFEILYPFTTGFFCGLSSIVIVYPLWKRFKRHAGLALAASRGFFILGIIPVYPLIKIVNPEDEELSKIRDKIFYTPNLMGRFSETMAYYCLIITGFGIVGCLIMNSKLKNQAEVRQKLLKKYKNDNVEEINLNENKILNNLETLNGVPNDINPRMNRNSLDTQKLIRKELNISMAKVFAVGFMFAVMSLHSIYFEHKYVELNISNARPLMTLGIVLIVIFILGWAYDKYKNLTFYFGFIIMLLFLTHTWVFNHFITLHNRICLLGLYIVFSVLVNSIEIVVAMTLLRIANGQINCHFALRTFSMTAYGAVISCLIHIYFETRFERIDVVYELIISTSLIIGSIVLLFIQTTHIDFGKNN